MDNKDFFYDCNTIRHLFIYLNLFSLANRKDSIYVSAFTTMPYVERISILLLSQYSLKEHEVNKLLNSLLSKDLNLFYLSFCFSWRWPKQGCCLFRVSLAFERHDLARTREVINIGLYAIAKTVPLRKVVDVRSWKPIYLIESNSDLIKKKMAKVTCVLFWAKW